MDTRTRPPTSVGEMLTMEFLRPMRMSRAELADRMCVAETVVDDLISGDQRVTEELADKLAEAFGNTSAFWLNCQAATDRWRAELTASGRD